MMGGRVWVESESGKGSTFRFTSVFDLKENSAVAAAAELDQPAPASRTRRLRLLLAEDNPVNQLLAARLLEKQGHEVVVVANGQEAIEVSARDPFDAVLMDVQMPVVDGMTATRTIREREKRTGAHLPIIALTARAMDEDRGLCTAAGMDGFLSKPIHSSQLLALLNSLGSGN
jgi:CheY-like chemotaxis protein